jgi:alkylated DNA repair dioxygenase AlkB
VALARGAWIAFDKAWLDGAEADALLRTLISNQPWEHRPIVVAGREILQPRLISWAGELPYRYSGQTLPPREADPVLADLLARASAALGVPFNHVLLNRYRDGRDHMGFHADSEPELGTCPTIGALSLGARRRFVIARKGRRRARKNYRLTHGSLMVMGGTMQHTWYHAVPKDAECSQERVNVTFRWLKGPPGWREPRPETA